MPYGSGYGMGGFGGSGVGGSIAQGLHAGFEMGRQVDLDKAAKEQREFENQRQTEADARAQQAADIATAHQGYLATNQLLANHRARGNALAEQYGGPTQVPEDIGEQYRQEGQGYLDTQKAHLQKIAGYVAAGKQQAQDDATNMAAGKLDPLSDKYPAKQLVHAFTATTGRPITDLLRGPNGELSPVEQAGEDLHNGIKFGNEGMVLNAANTLFSRELQTGVGQPSPHGGTIIGKQIVKILPAPSDPNNPNDPNAGKVTPVIRVFVREGGGEGENYGNEGRNVQGPEQLQYGAPAGATGHYDAPVTQNRSTDPNDPIAHISMEDAMNRVEQLKAAAGSIAGDPRLRAKVDRGIEEGGTQHNTFLNAYRAMGGTMPGATYEDITKPTLRLKKNAAGEVVGQEELVPPAKETPEPIEKTGPLAKAIADIRNDPNLSATDREKAVRMHLGLDAKATAPKSGSAIREKNEAIDSALANGEITKAQAEQAKLKTLGVESGGMSGREGIFVNRVLIAANEGVKDLLNITRLKISSDTGFFGGRKQGPSLLDAGKEVLANKMTSQEAQSYNVRSAGMQRAAAAIESAGLAPSGQLTHSMEAIQFHEGDTQQTKMEKLAQARQIVDAGLETTLANPKLAPEQREHIKSILDNLHTAIPFTMADIDKLGTAQEKNPSMTIGQIMKARGWKPNAPAAPAPAATPRSGTGLTQPQDTGEGATNDLYRAYSDATQRLNVSKPGSPEEARAIADTKALDDEITRKTGRKPQLPSTDRNTKPAAPAGVTVSNW